MKTAQVLKYDLEKGFGFLVEQNNTRHFFHITNCIGFVPQVGMVVAFEVGEGRRGPAAINLRLIPVAPVVPVATDTSAVKLLADDASPKSEVSRG